MPVVLLNSERDRDTIDHGRGPRRPQRADEQYTNRPSEEMEMGPSVLLAISQRNMWVKRKIMHARRLARLLIRGSAGQTSTRGRDPAVCPEFTIVVETMTWGVSQGQLKMTGAECNGERFEGTRLSPSRYHSNSPTAGLVNFMAGGGPREWGGPTYVDGTLTNSSHL